MQLGAVGSGDAVRRPGPALLDERAVRGGMRVARPDDERDGARHADERRHDRIATGHAERAAGQEVVLHVDRDQRGVRIHLELLFFVVGSSLVITTAHRGQTRAQREQLR